jgi:hypothetical protein
MESQRNRESEGVFFALEQESITNFSSRLPKPLKAGYWYGCFSDYGTNYNKSLFWLVLFIVGFGFIYSVIASPVMGFQYKVDYNLIGESMIYSVKQVVSPFSSFKELMPFSGEGEHRVLLGLVSCVESIIAIILITFTVISLRWQFKRG